MQLVELAAAGWEAGVVQLGELQTLSAVEEVEEPLEVDEAALCTEPFRVGVSVDLTPKNELKRSADVAFHSEDFGPPGPRPRNAMRSFRRNGLRIRCAIVRGKGARAARFTLWGGCVLGGARSL